MRLSFLRVATFAAVLVFIASATSAAEPPPYLAGYLNDEAFDARFQTIEPSDLAIYDSLGKSVGGRQLWVVKVGRGELDQKPAIAVIGDMDGSRLLGAEVTLRMLEQLLQQARESKEVDDLFDRYTFYFLPRPNPDAAEKCFASPLRTPVGNDRRTDDDRDFETGEDPADDLNGDGVITQMRIEDPTGDYIVHPADNRLMVKVDPKKNERGTHRVLIEGRDDDGDEEFNEDGAEGVAIGHNFPHQYRPFRKQTGEHAASEPETRAVIDFLFDHPNIVAVFGFSAEDNLFHPWKENKDRERIRKSIFPADATALELIASDYKKLHGGSDAPQGPGAHGSFNEWAYYQYGRWSLAALGWWPPKVEAKTDEKKADDSKDDASDSDEEAPKKQPDAASDDKRAADELNLLRYLESKEIDGFVAWQEVEHPDFPGKKVEVGGFRPLVGVNPPADELDDLADTHLKFLLKLPEYLPEIEIVDAKAEGLGGGVFRVSAKVLNRGYLPTMPEMGQTNEQPYPLQFALDLPERAELLQGNARERIGRLKSGEHAEKTWLVRFTKDTPEKLKFKAWAPSLGREEVDVPLK